MELAVAGAKGLGEPNERVRDRSEDADTSPAVFKTLALNFLLHLSHSLKSLSGDGGLNPLLVRTKATLVPALSSPRSILAA